MEYLLSVRFFHIYMGTIADADVLPWALTALPFMLPLFAINYEEKSDFVVRLIPGGFM